MVEADPNMFKKLQRNRPDAVTINAVVSKEAQEETWVAFDNSYLSGIQRYLDMEKLQPMLDKGKLHIKSKIPIQSIPLGQLLQQNMVRTLDLLSLDVEGAEMAVLQSVAWSDAKVQIGVLMVERGLANGIPDFLKSVGYELVGSILWDAVFVNRRFCETGRLHSLEILRSDFQEFLEQPWFKKEACKCMKSVKSLSKFSATACTQYCGTK